MTIVTPSSLKWLINQYQSRQRQVREIEEHISVLLLEKQKIQAELEPLAKVIEIHEVPILAEDIPQLRSKKMYSGLPYGALTRLIYQYLGSLPTGVDASVSEVFYYCFASPNVENATDQVYARLLKSVRKQLKNLAYKGKIEITLAGNTFKDSRYRLYASKPSTSDHIK